MLKIYYGKKNFDKERFIYDNLAGPAMVIVPDQYTLGAEKQAIKYLNAPGLMDVEIISMSRLGYRLLGELGGGKTTFIDKYGRHMLLSQIARESRDDLQVYRGFEDKNSFIEMVNNFISEMKQYNAGAGDLREMAEALKEDSFFKKKLADLELIYSKYEQRIAGKYTDSEDYIDLFLGKIGQSAFVRENEVWVYDFESFAPKALGVLGELMKYARDVNIVMTLDADGPDRDAQMFKLPQMVIANLRAKAEEMGARAQVCCLEKLTGADYQIDLTARETTIVKAASIYNEAESAAAFVMELIRDKGLRHREIALICNDQNMRSSVIERIFAEYGIEIFVDKKRGILNSPIIIFAIALLDIVIEGYRTQDIFRLLKTGLTELDVTDIEDLENYALQYKIRGTMWQKPFAKGRGELGDEVFGRVEAARQATVDIIGRFEKLHKTADNIREFTTGFYEFLVDDIKIAAKIEEYITLQQGKGLMEEANETAQIWGKMMGIMDQIVALIGDDKFDGKTFRDLFEVGFEEVEVGVLPPTADGIILGTMQRTRCSGIKALLVMGANEGVLPAGPASEGLFSDDEKQIFFDAGKEICKADNIRTLEESLAIYKNLAKPTEHLWVSYATSDEEGHEARASELIEQIEESSEKQGSKVKHLLDVLNRDEEMDLVGGEVNTLRHLAGAMRCKPESPSNQACWQETLHWYEEHRKEAAEILRQGLAFKNELPPVGRQLAEALFNRRGGDMSVSPSRLEKYSRCPFSHYVLYGLRPEERRVYEVSPREIGDVYHSCLMKYSERLTEAGVGLTDVNSKWMTISYEECFALAREIVASEAGSYREGLLTQGKEEQYKMERIAEICGEICWVLTTQVRTGKIKAGYFEVGFGRGRQIAPIEIDLGDRKVYIEGQIDRLDVLPNDRAKVIDYKTGNEKFSVEEAKAGYRLQLMLYLAAAGERKPAGVFYFLVGEPSINMTGKDQNELADKIGDAVKKEFKLNGVMVNDPETIDSIAGDFEKFSDILPLRNGKDGISGTSEGFLMEEEEFVEFQQEFDGKVKELCNNLVRGCIELKPKKSGEKTPCDYCGYKGICRFDLLFDGCSFETI